MIECQERSLIPLERIERSILLIRGQKVMLSTDLAELYQVKPRVLDQAVKRNIARFSRGFYVPVDRRRIF